MSKFLQSLILALMLSQLSGCGVYRANQGSAAIMNLNLGDSKEVLIAKMGQPKSKEVYGGKEYWLYRTGLGSTEADLYTPVFIVDGKVSGWGKNYFSDIRKQSEIYSSPSYSSGGVVVIQQPAPIKYPDPPRLEIKRQPAFIDSPQQQPIQPPSVNCMPNGSGGFRCQ